MNTDRRGSRGTKGTLNGRGVLFWGNKRSTTIEPIAATPTRTIIKMAHHLACNKPCEAQIISAQTPAKPMQLTTVAISANKAVLRDGLRVSRNSTPNSGVSSSEMSFSAKCELKLVSELFSLMRPIVSG